MPCSALLSQEYSAIAHQGQILKKGGKKMEKALTEYDLVVQFRDARERLNRLKEAATEAQKEFDETEQKLIERLQDENKESTARYEKIGYVGITKPSVYASFSPENKDALFKFLRSRDRQDLIQKTVKKRSLKKHITKIFWKKRNNNPP